MKSLNRQFYPFLIVSIFALLSCKKQQDRSEQTESPSGIKEALTFYASFDNGIKADFALGDDQLYTSPIKSIDSAKVGLHKPDIMIDENSGLLGNSLKFTDRSSGYIFYRSENNIAYDTTDWSGAISFWLKLDPAIDLKPGYCDPIQITDVSYNDAAIWVDFTKENPRDFRLGVIGDRDSWNPKPDGPDNENPIFIEQLPVAKDFPFSSDEWTHIFINFENLNTGNGSASLYLNGKLNGTRENIADPFTWDYNKSNILLGLGYIGLMDEISLFNRALSEEEIKMIYEKKNCIKELL